MVKGWIIIPGVRKVWKRDLLSIPLCFLTRRTKRDVITADTIVMATPITISLAICRFCLGGTFVVVPPAKGSLIGTL